MRGSGLIDSPTDTWAFSARPPTFTKKRCQLVCWQRVARLSQSYLWNSAASHRAREFGLDGAVAGDLVLAEGAAADAVDGIGAADAADDGEGDEAGASLRSPQAWCKRW